LRQGFNPVLGFLSVSTRELPIEELADGEFQSRAGFSECLDEITTDDGLTNK